MALNIFQKTLPRFRRIFLSNYTSSMRFTTPVTPLKLEAMEGCNGSSSSFISPSLPLDPLSKERIADGSNKVISILSEDDQEFGARHGANVISTGGLIAAPTDTIYGIAADAQNDVAISKIYEIKGRIASKPIAICVSKIDQIYQWGKVNVPRQLLEDLLPGPVTLVFERESVLNTNLNPNTNLIGIRIPDHKFIMKLAELHGGPVALTSANFSNEPSTLAVEEFKGMWPSLNCIFDGGRLSSCEKSEAAARAGSTVIDLSKQGCFTIIRDGTAFTQCVDLLKSKYGLRQCG